MSFLKSSYNLCVIELPKEFKITQSEAYDRMRKNRFMELTPSQEFGHGFVAVDDIFKSEFSMDDIVSAGYVVGGYRFDQKVVPKPLIKKLYRERKREREKETGEKLKKEEKLILKEECKAQLVLKALPNPKMVSWILDFDNSCVYLDTKSTKVIDSFVSLFVDTFEVHISIKDFGVTEIGKFLDWIWENKGNLEKVWIDNGITLDADKATFKFNGQNLGDYLEEIQLLKKSKTIKNLSIGLVLNKNDYCVTFNDKNLVFSMENKNKIKHESVESAVIDNADNIISVVKKVEELVKMYLKK